MTRPRKLSSTVDVRLASGTRETQRIRKRDAQTEEFGERVEMFPLARAYDRDRETAFPIERETQDIFRTIVDSLLITHTCGRARARGIYRSSRCIRDRCIISEIIPSRSDGPRAARRVLIGTFHTIIPIS